MTSPDESASKAAEKLKERIALLAALGETGNMSLAGIAAHEARLRSELARTHTTLAERVELERALLEIRQQLAEHGKAVADAVATALGVDRVIEQQRDRDLRPPRTPGIQIDPDGVPIWGGDPASLDPTSVWERLDEQINQGKSSLELLRDTIDDITTGSLVSFGDAITNAFAAMVTGAQSAGAAFGAAMLGALGSVAKAFGDFFVGQAIASIASSLAPVPNPAGKVAAGKYLAAATAMYALAGAFGGAASAVGGGGGRAGAFNTTNSFAGAAKGDGYLIVEGDFLDLNNPITKQRFRRALEEFSGRRVHIRNSRFGPIR